MRQTASSCGGLGSRIGYRQLETISILTLPFTPKALICLAAADCVEFYHYSRDPMPGPRYTLVRIVSIFRLPNYRFCVANP